MWLISELVNCWWLVLNLVLLFKVCWLCFVVRELGLTISVAVVCCGWWFELRCLDFSAGSLVLCLLFVLFGVAVVLPVLLLWGCLGLVFLLGFGFIVWALLFAFPFDELLGLLVDDVVVCFSCWYWLDCDCSLRC